MPTRRGGAASSAGLETPSSFGGHVVGNAEREAQETRWLQQIVNYSCDERKEHRSEGSLQREARKGGDGAGGKDQSSGRTWIPGLCWTACRRRLPFKASLAAIISAVQTTAQRLPGNRERERDHKAHRKMHSKYWFYMAFSFFLIYMLYE